MAAASRSSKWGPLGVSAGPESVTLIESTNIDVDSTVEFTVVGPCEGVEVDIVSATAKTGTPSVVFSIEGYDPESKTWVSLISSAAVTDAGNDWLLVSHHASAVANHSVGRVVRERMRLKIDYTGTPVTDVLNGVTATVFAI